MGKGKEEVKTFKIFYNFFYLGFLQTIGGVFDTDKLALAEIIEVPNAITGCAAF